jgi:hypothetical protein
MTKKEKRIKEVGEQENGSILSLQHHFQNECPVNKAPKDSAAYSLRNERLKEIWKYFEHEINKCMYFPQGCFS